jgi:hypothetical protein
MANTSTLIYNQLVFAPYAVGRDGYKHPPPTGARPSASARTDVSTAVDAEAMPRRGQD